MRIIAQLASLLLMLGGTGAAEGQQLVSALSKHTVQITSSFVGDSLTYFGSIEPGPEGTSVDAQGPLDIVIVVSGPVTPLVTISRMTNAFGIWLNTEHESFRDLPAYFRVFSNRPLNEITDRATLAAAGISPATRIGDAAAEGGRVTASLMQDELIRFMEQRQRFDVIEDGVTFYSPALYAARLDLPPDVPSGEFSLHTYLFRHGQIIDTRPDNFVVQTKGLENFLRDAAHLQPLAYGLACVVLALFTGWLGGVLFKR